MRISDWSSDVCSSDLTQLRCQDLQPRAGEGDGEDCLEPTAQFRVAGSERRTGEQQRIAVEQQQALQADRGDDQRQSLDRGARRHAHGIERAEERSEEHTSELQSLMRISYAVFCLKKK